MIWRSDQTGAPRTDMTEPHWRASAIGVYRLWRDGGHALGALLTGFLADAFGMTTAFAAVGCLTFFSGVVVQVAMRETLGAHVEASRVRLGRVAP